VNLQDLMQAYRDGDPVALTELYARVAPRIRAYLCSLIRDSTTADDLLQQTFAKLHAARHGYVQGADAVPWLYTIARRACIDDASSPP
jgi:RNA polymerase sigma-70 factor, ECF subfamily